VDEVGGEPISIPVNCFLLRTGDELLLVDAGCGVAFGSCAGQLVGSLRLAGFAPSDVTSILMTHLHVDHTGGLVDADGAAVFTRAQLHVSDVEAAYWRALAASGADPDLSTKAAGAALDAYGDRLSYFAQGARLHAGIESVPLPGHTPGHTGFMITDRGERLMIWGDIVHSTAVQFARPDYGYAADVDGAQGVETRRRMFAVAADTRLAIAGMHLPFPGMGGIAQAGGAFSFVPREAS
jgi:glyoxylase-like metal-dependent hydrolase (beta-lactamase superfamily II)